MSFLKGIAPHTARRVPVKKRFKNRLERTPQARKNRGAPKEIVSCGNKLVYTIQVSFRILEHYMNYDDCRTETISAAMVTGHQRRFEKEPHFC